MPLGGILNCPDEFLFVISLYIVYKWPDVHMIDTVPIIVGEMHAKMMTTWFICFSMINQH